MTLKYLKIFRCFIYLIFIIIREASSFKSMSHNSYSIMLYYHLVLTEIKFKSINQLNYTPIMCPLVSLSFLYKIISKKNLISITLDDGLSCILKNVIPELKRKEIPATIFIPRLILIITQIGNKNGRKFTMKIES